MSRMKVARSAGKQKATEMHVGQGEVEGKWQHVLASAGV